MCLVAAERIEWRVAASSSLSNSTELRWQKVPRSHVLAGQTHVVAFLQQRAERQHLAGRPVDPGVGVHCVRRCSP